MKIQQTQAGVCFVILSSFALLYGLSILALSLSLFTDEPWSPSRGLVCSAPFFVSAICAWAAWFMFRRAAAAGWMAAFAWCLVGVVVGLWLLAAVQTPSALNLLAVAVLIVLETVIAVHLLQRTRKSDD
jgi:hypothetical protein